MGTQTFTGTLVVIDCARSITFGITERFRDGRRGDHANFYCPAGHPNHWPQETDAERLRRQLEQRDRLLAGARADRDATARSARATRGHVTRLKRRIAAGRCIACSERFPDLAAHMADAHPEADA